MERIQPDDVHPYVWADHIHRYKWASQFAKGRVLDFACGVGYGSTYILESGLVRSYTGADLSFEAIQYANREYRFPSVSFLISHSDYLPFKNHVFDTIICFETLEHLDHPELLIQQFSSLLTEDGILLGSVPSRRQEEKITKIYGKNPYYKTKFDLIRINRLLNQYFTKIIYFRQSLEVRSLVVPLERIKYGSQGKIIEDISLPNLEDGNFLFIATNEVDIPDDLRNQISFTPALSLFVVDENYNRHLNNLNEEKLRLEQELEMVRVRSAEELKQLNEEKLRLEQELEMVRVRSAEELKRMSEEIKKNLEQRLYQAEISLRKLEERTKQLELENHNLINTLQEIERSRYWRMVKWLWRQPIYLKLRNFILRNKNNETFEHHDSIESDVLPSSPAELTSSTANQHKTIFRQLPPITSDKMFSDEEIKWIESTHEKKSQVVCVLHPEWRGIHASAEQMFDVLLEIPDNLDPQKAFHYAALLAETGCKMVVISGFPVSYRYLVIALRERFPKIKVLVIYHGHYNQYREDYDRLSYSTMLNLAMAGKIDKLGFVKSGMAEIISAARGVKTGFVMNWVDRVPEKPSLPMDGGPHLGMWLLWSGNWQKPPFAMLASSLLIPGSIVHGADSDERMQEYIQLMNIRANFAGRPLPHQELLDTMARMHVNLYVTFHECAPMLPLESLSMGAPCLLGPVSHYFEDEPYLHQRLVVPYPERAEVIAEFAIRAIEERDQIIQHYKEYIPFYNQRARQQLAEFLNS